jgi:hypothetical protein
VQETTTDGDIKQDTFGAVLTAWLEVALTVESTSLQCITQVTRCQSWVCLLAMGPTWSQMRAAKRLALMLFPVMD